MGEQTFVTLTVTPPAEDGLMVAIATTQQRRVPRRPVRVVLHPVTRQESRVYRRRRLAVLCAVLSILVLPAVLVATGGAGSSTTVSPASAPVPAAEAARTVYVVQPGDTLGGIAAKVDPAADPRETVDRLVELNGGSALEPGQRLRLTAH